MTKEEKDGALVIAAVGVDESGKTVLLPRYSVDSNSLVARNWEKVHRAVVRIRHCEATGTGFFFSADCRLIATAHHVIGQQRTCKIDTADGQVLRARALCYHSYRDLAVLHVEEPLEQIPAPWLIQASAYKPSWGAFVQAIGHADARAQAHLSIGSIWREAEGLHLALRTRPGMSGSPLLDAWGRVIGVVTRGGTEDGISSAAPASALIELLTFAQGLLEKRSEEAAA